MENRRLVLTALLGLAPSRPFILALRQSRLRFQVRSAMDIWILKEVALDQDYESFGVRLEDGWKVLDIGAGFGAFAVAVGGRLLATTVYAFEPFPGSYALLCENIRINGLRNVQAFPEAVAARPGRASLFGTSADPLQLTMAAQDETVSPSVLEVNATSLDRIFDDLQLDRCDFLKIDCEGGEYEILFNASAQTLNKTRHICLEYHDGVTMHSHGDLARFLEERGFIVSLRPNPAQRQLGLLSASKAL